ncbi:hypothetical protein [Falsiroseomonas sp. HW251]|uniref:hypothetical protein n=1 Tax=Falsiroseomonas sp. HW251 TaxID=3390998 RepID=UPI003D3123D1
MGDAFIGLRHRPLWCAWRAESVEKNGQRRIQKIPYMTPDVRAKTNSPGRWLWRERADDLVACFEAQGFKTGIGIRLGQRETDGHMLAAIDLDACRDPDTGVIEPWAQALLDRFPGAYCETSPSGTGLHLLFLLTDADVSAMQAVIPIKKTGKKWRREAMAGEKAPAIELMIGSYITVTGAHVLPSPMRIAPVARDALLWLVTVGWREFLGDQAMQPPAVMKAPMPASAAATAPSRMTTPSKSSAQGRRPPAEPGTAQRMIRWVNSWLARLAVELDDAEFQVFAALSAYGRATRPGWRRSVVPRERLCELPGADRGSYRGAGTIWAAEQRLVEKKLLAKAKNYEPPMFGRPGRVTEFDVVALMPPDVDASGPRPDVGRMLADAWIGMVWRGLPPFALRVICWLLATRVQHDVFTLSVGETAKTFRVTEERASRALDALAASPYLEVLEPPDAARRRPGRYRLGSIFDEASIPTTPPTTHHPPW